MKYILFAFSMVFLFACNNDKPKSKTVESTETVSETKVKEAKVQSDLTEITITSNDMMQYDKQILKAEAGQKVVLTLKHVGKMSMDMMGHNWVLLKQGVDLKTFAAAAAKAKENDYIPEGSKDIIAHTKMLGGGQEDTITFTAPEAGVYEFFCSFPGHWAIMKGKFIVE